VGRSTICVHSHQDRSSFEQLHLLVLGDQQLGSVLPLRRVFPSAYQSLALFPRIHTVDRSTHKCLLRQLPCLYALPQWSHFNSPVAAFSFFVKAVPSLARRFAFDLSTEGNEDSAGPSVRTPALLPARPGIEPCWGRLLGTGVCSVSLRMFRAGFELRRLRETEPSATPFSTAASIAAALPGANDELFLLLIRPVPSGAVCVRLYGWRAGRLDGIEPTEGRCWVAVWRDISCSACD